MHFGATWGLPLTSGTGTPPVCPVLSQMSWRLRRQPSGCSLCRSLCLCPSFFGWGSLVLLTCDQLCTSLEAPSS